MKLCWLVACLLTAPPTDSELFEMVLRPTEAVLAQAVGDLGHADFSVRERASLLLWCCGEKAQDVLKKGTESKDLEVRTRAKLLLKKLQNGEMPTVRDERLRGVLLFRSRHWFAGLRLLLQTDDEATALMLLDEFPADQQDQLTDYYARLREYSARKLILADRLDEAESLLRGAVRMQKDVVPLRTYPNTIRRQLAALLFARGVTLDEFSRAESVASLGGSVKHKEVLAWLFKARGEFDAAAKLATEMNDSHLQQVLRIESSDWKGLFAEAARDQHSNLRGTTQRLALLPKLDHDDQAADLLRELRAFVVAKPVLLDEAVGHLLLVPRPTEALELTREVRRHTTFKLLVGELRFREAFAAVGIEVPLRDPETWLDKLWADQPESAKNEWINNISLRAGDAAFVAQIVSRLGETETALRLMRKAGELAATDQSEALGWGLHSIWDEELKLGLEDRAWQHLAAAIQKMPKQQHEALSRQRPNLAGVWWDVRRSTRSEESLAESARFVVRLTDPATAPGLPADDARAEIEALAQQARELSGDERIRKLRAAAETATLHKLDDLAHSLWLNLESLEPTPRTALAVADGYAAKQDWVEAAKWYAHVWPREPVAAKTSRIDSRDDESKWDGHEWNRDHRRLLSLVLRAHALFKNGNDAESDRCRRIAQIWPLSDSEMRLNVAYELDRRGLNDLALEQFTQARAFANEEYELSNIYIHLAEQQASTAPAEAARLWEKVRLLTMQDGSFLTSDEVDLPYGADQELMQRIQQLNAKELIATGNIEQGLQAALAAEAACPIHLKLTVELVPLFENAGAKEAADKLYQQLWARRQSVLADFPNAAEFHDQLASLGVTCQRELDVSLTHARRAVARRSKHVPYRLTQTRVHLARREFVEARQQLAEAKALAPSQPEVLALQRQLEQATSPLKEKP